jgi:methylenetetrahydrofolate dehydrogenase (NADP+) / methenyltetrahydrofolate cyclohydrolase
MAVQWLDGSSLAKQIKAELKQEIGAFTQTQGTAPTLAVLRVGDDEAAAGYARAIEKNCKSVGVSYVQETQPQDATLADVITALERLNGDSTVHGIMMLEPMPNQIDPTTLLLALNPDKDVDGVHPLNAGKLMAQRPPFFAPATPLGGMRLLEEAGVEFRGKEAVVVGRSDIVGKPMALLLLHRHCTVTIAHSRTVDLPAVCRRADILCVAVGRPEMVRGEWIKPGAVVVDFGTNYLEEGLKGDCAQAEVAEVAGMLTPVPGGTGPMTNAILMQNVLQAAKLACGAGTTL